MFRLQDAPHTHTMSHTHTFTHLHITVCMRRIHRTNTPYLTHIHLSPAHTGVCSLHCILTAYTLTALLLYCFVFFHQHFVVRIDHYLLTEAYIPLQIKRSLIDHFWLTEAHRPIAYWLAGLPQCPQLKVITYYLSYSLCLGLANELSQWVSVFRGEDLELQSGTSWCHVKSHSPCLLQLVTILN